MRPAITAELARRGTQRGIHHVDAQMLALALLVGWNEGREAPDGEGLLRNLAMGLPEDDHGSALTAARDWLLDPGLSSQEWDWVNDSLRFLKDTATGSIDWTVEADHCLTGDMRNGIMSLSSPLARSIAGILDLPLHASVGCLFSPSASLAWVLAEDRDVTVFAEQSIAIMLALLSRAACRPLKVRRENPIDGSLSPAQYARTDRQPPFERYDFLVSVPPFGARVQDGPGKGMTFESYQAQVLASRAREAFFSLVPDGSLFRESEAESRARFLSDFGVTVLSLPPGVFWPATSIATTLLRLTPGVAKSARLIEGRTMGKVGSGRPQETLVTQHLENFRGFRVDNPERAADVSLEELAENNFSLLPERYVRSASLAAIEKALEQRPTVTLGDIADIERGKAPMPIRDPDDEPAFTAMEVVPADLVDGIVRTPSRQQVFDSKEEKRVQGVTVHANDILVSIKGNVGSVGIVEDAGVHLDRIMGEPWIVSQSLAIVRLKPNPHIRSPTVLAALLSAPWVREKLESMSGASTVRTLPLSALRSLSLPVPSAEECALAEEKLATIDEVRELIEKHQNSLAETRRQLWAQLWQIHEEFEEH